MSHRRGPALLCLLLATVLTLSAAAVSSRGEPRPAVPHSLEEETVHYGETPAVRIIPLTDLERADTQATDGMTVPVDPAEMSAVLAECTLQDGTIIRLYAAAEGRIDGAFARPDQGWFRFVRLSDGTSASAAFAVNPTLTPFDGVLGKTGFLLRYANPAGIYTYDYCWFDPDGSLRTLRATFDPVALDLDGDGTAELAWEIAEWQNSFSFYCRGADGALYQVTPGACLENGGTLVAVEQEGPGPVRLIYRCEDDAGQTSFCAATFQDGALRIEPNIAYVPAAPEDTVAVPDPTAGRTALPHVSVTAPDGRTMDGAGEAAYLDLWSLLWNSPYAAPAGAVVVSTDAPLDEETAYTVTFSDPEAGESFSWSLDAEGVCRFDGIAGNCRLVCTGSGSLPAYCHDVLSLYCEASRTARNYDDQGRWLGWDLVPVQSKAG